MDGHRVDILRDGVIVATGRWTGQRIEQSAACLVQDEIEDPDEALEASDAIYAKLEEQLAAEEAAALAAPAYDEQGVDLTLIDWVLDMTPRERLEMIESYAGVPFGRILEVLEDHEVEFIVIGGVAASLQGADWNTKDLDILYSRDAGNIRRLLDALSVLEARFRDLTGRRVVPTESHLLTHGPKLLLTKFGPLDLLGTLSMHDDETTYQSLVDQTATLETPRLSIRVLTLEGLIEVKKRAARPQDLRTLPILQAALERSRQRG
ncbi:hypothetical protein [Sorangium cellulosum]|uniref:hypothetical protein n=1 Tax=Sorangium cellulosum TaxID=56 RepID=UPI001010DF18|nr:hypothetical protein [Sorangium cellulosum]